jgi:hypothetical protein
MAMPLDSKPARAELVEALSFLSARDSKKEGQPFDKLRVSGFILSPNWVAA